MSSRLSALLLAALAAGSSAFAGPWSVRVAATWLETVDKSTNSAVPVEIEDKLIPEFDITYAFDAHWSAELVLTIPQEHSVKTAGTRLGSFKHLPPTLLAKYTFDPIGGFRPYVGAGANFTLIFDDDLAVGATPLKLDSFSVGPAVQAGFDWAINDVWSLNFDVKRAMLRTDVEAGGAKLTEARLDPWLYSVGLRYAF
ncbi:MAG: outer membrane beta-barrel protein [Opitutaceae bacterium]|jgi:outer membrane protein|nr:outer membrane beta-barrel protein [Opitutaceae bacterium]